MTEAFRHRLSEARDKGQYHFGNTYYKVVFSHGKNAGDYGYSYQFYLKDAMNGVPEYVVYWEELVK